MAAKRQKLYLIDGASYIYRAYHAIRPLSTSKGLPTNALYGFVRMLIKLLKEERPDRLAVVFDTVEPTFRDDLFEDYKANRPPPPDDLVPQFPYFEPLVDMLGIKGFSKPGFEADDVIGTIARKAEKDGYDVVIITGDKDFMQLVTDHIRLYDTMKEKWVGRAEVKERFGVEPEKVIDVMSLIGDSSDNIPGVSGIGNKTAVNLIKQFGGLKNLISNVEKVSNARARAALEGGVKKAELSRDLVTIKLDVPIEFKWDDFEVGKKDAAKVKELLSELEFFKLLRELLPQEEDEPGGEDCRLISCGKDMDKLAGALKSSGRLALYFLEGGEKSGRPFLGFGICWSESEAAYIPLAHDTIEDVANIDADGVKAFFEGLKGKRKFIYGAKHILRQLEALGISGDIDDVRLMSYVLNPSYPSDMVTLAQQVLGVHIKGQGSGVKGKGGEEGKGEAVSGVTVREAARRAGGLAVIIYQLAGKFSDDLEENHSLARLYSEVEMPLVGVLSRMEQKGIKVDVKRLKDLSKEYHEKISELEGEIYKEAGEGFQINSPKQLAYILFEKLKLPPVRKTKTGYSTDAAVLTQLAEKYDLPRLILEYRSLTKLTSTYIDVLPTLVDSGGRIHTTFNQAVTATGRLSSSDPNLQNIPARTDEGLRIRRAFVADKGLKLISADYSQIELRILAHISGEEELIRAFEKGVDIHSATAARIFGVDEAGVDTKMRAAAKTVNFGVLYGQGAYGLSQQLGIDVAEADAYIKNYYGGYPRVRELKEKILKDAAGNGFVETLFGRRRYVPDINSGNPQVKAFAERTAFNAVFQGTAADIIKKAMLELDEALEEKFPDAAMLLQVHDELVFEAPESIVEDLSDVIREKMCGVARLRVPLEIDISVGANWAECK